MIAGCTTRIPPPITAIPISWSQKPDETGRLPVGRVVGVELKSFENHYLSSSPTRIFLIRGLIVPIVVPPLDGIKYGNKAQQYYLYAIKQRGAAELSHWGEFVVYPAGSCVALREEPYLMIVPAIESECE